MHTLQLLLAGFGEVFKPLDLLMMFIGLLIGMAVSIMPGLGLVMGVVLALPFTYGMALEPSIILLTAIYMSGTYAGCFTAILYRIPGEPMDVPLLWDGYAMTQRGEASKALGWALVAALTGGLVSTAVMTTLATPLSEFALKFGAPEYFAAVFFGLTTVVALAGTSIPNALISLFLGLLVATIGTDSTYGIERFTFDSPILTNGVPYVMVLVGMYGFGEILIKLGQSLHVEVPPDRASTKTRFPSFQELWQLRATFVRSTVLGTILGVVPGAGATITSFVSYAIEKQYGRRGDKIGTGIPEGIVAPQIASTASVAGHIVPLLTLGIPGSGATAVILAAFLLHGVQPGPFLFSNPESTLVVYTIMASMFVAVVGMCLMGVLAAIVIMFCLVGAFADRNTISDMWMIVIFGTLAALFERYRFPVSPMVLGSILGPLAEDSYMRSMITYHRDWTVFFTQPIAGALMALSVVSLSYPIVRSLLARRRAMVAAIQYPDL